MSQKKLIYFLYVLIMIQYYIIVMASGNFYIISYYERAIKGYYKGGITENTFIRFFYTQMRVMAGNTGE